MFEIHDFFQEFNFLLQAVAFFLLSLVFLTNIFCYWKRVFCQSKYIVILCTNLLCRILLVFIQMFQKQNLKWFVYSLYYITILFFFPFVVLYHKVSAIQLSLYNFFKITFSFVAFEICIGISSTLTFVVRLYYLQILHRLLSFVLLLFCDFNQLLQV